MIFSVDKGNVLTETILGNGKWKGRLYWQWSGYFLSDFRTIYFSLTVADSAGTWIAGDLGEIKVHTDHPCHLSVAEYHWKPLTMMLEMLPLVNESARINSHIYFTRWIYALPYWPLFYLNQYHLTAEQQGPCPAILEENARELTLTSSKSSTIELAEYWAQYT